MTFKSKDKIYLPSLLSNDVRKRVGSYLLRTVPSNLNGAHYYYGNAISSLDFDLYTQKKVLYTVFLPLSTYYFSITFKI